MSNSTLRILTALLGVPLVIGLTYVGGWAFGLLLLAAALVAQHELYGLMAAGGLHPHRAFGLAMGALLGLRVFLPQSVPLAFVVLLVFLACIPFLAEDRSRPGSLAATVFGAIYPTTLLTFLIDLRTARGPEVGDVEAFWLTLATLLLIWATDTFAYYVGRSIGRRPLAPKVSPKKTWEGTIGGAVGALVVAVVLKVMVLDFLAWGHVIVLAVLCGGVSQLGDLAESRMKRAVGVKDSGTILPGHGGLLDRFDAMVLAAPCVYLYLDYVAGVFL